MVCRQEDVMAALRRTVHGRKVHDRLIHLVVRGMTATPVTTAVQASANSRGQRVRTLRLHGEHLACLLRRSEASTSEPPERFLLTSCSVGTSPSRISSTHNPSPLPHDHSAESGDLAPGTLLSGPSSSKDAATNIARIASR